jgi:hypothetical protein
MHTPPSRRAAALDTAAEGLLWADVQRCAAATHGREVGALLEEKGRLGRERVWLRGAKEDLCAGLAELEARLARLARLRAGHAAAHEQLARQQDTAALAQREVAGLSGLVVARVEALLACAAAQLAATASAGRARDAEAEALGLARADAAQWQAAAAGLGGRRRGLRKGRSNGSMCVGWRRRRCGGRGMRSRG